MKAFVLFLLKKTVKQNRSHIGHRDKQWTADVYR